jgi:hypothetical protein
MSLCLLSFLGGVLDRASAILCGSDAVMCPVLGRIITPLPHNIAQLLTSPHLNCYHSICCWFVLVVLVVVSLSSLFLSSFHCYHPFFALYFYPWKCGLLSAFTCVLLSPLGKRVTNPCLLWQSLVSIGKEGYQSLSASAVTISTLEVAEYRLIFLGGGWPDDVWFPRRSGDSPPLVVVWDEDALIMRQTLMM